MCPKVCYLHDFGPQRCRTKTVRIAYDCRPVRCPKPCYMVMGTGLQRGKRISLFSSGVCARNVLVALLSRITQTQGNQKEGTTNS